MLQFDPRIYSQNYQQRSLFVLTILKERLSLSAEDMVHYISYIIVLGVGYSALAMIFYTSAILCSTWKQKASPLTSRLLRIAYADLLPSLSMAIMITFSCVSGALLIYYFFPKWILCVVAALTLVPPTLGSVGLVWLAYN